MRWTTVITSHFNIVTSVTRHLFILVAVCQSSLSAYTHTHTYAHACRLTHTDTHTHASPSALTPAESSGGDPVMCVWAFLWITCYMSGADDGGEEEEEELLRPLSPCQLCGVVSWVEVRNPSISSSVFILESVSLAVRCAWLGARLSSLFE